MSNQWASDQFHIYSCRRKNKIIWPTLCIVCVPKQNFRFSVSEPSSSLKPAFYVMSREAVCVTQPWAPSGFSTTTYLQDSKSVSCAGTACCSHVAFTRSRPKLFCMDLLLFVKFINLVWLNFISAWLGASWDPGNWLSSLPYELCSCSQNIKKNEKTYFFLFSILQP